jgi:hypothetical protein
MRMTKDRIAHLAMQAPEIHKRYEMLRVLSARLHEIVRAGEYAWLTR